MTPDPTYDVFLSHSHADAAWVHELATKLAAETGLGAQAVEAALETLARHDVLVPDGGRWRAAVELMRRWVLGEFERG